MLIIVKYFQFLAMTWLLESQVIFYTLLGIVLVIMAIGLLRMKNWARITTIIYTLLIIIFAFVYFAFFLITGYDYMFFDVNILAVLFSFGPRDYFALLGLFTTVISLIIGIAILVYLFGDVRYEFQ
ncbi:MAG: hypothetical protein ACUVXA_19920 [Candidatus Jordarchaeum sp.]|uniref:hypothetical protein n=1 Tax=Candidatus Jordarchaeum sp. TaxID=2823881 RepID=UPI00404B7D88